MSSKEKFFHCDCYCSGILAEVETETVPSLPFATTTSFSMSLYQRVGNTKLSWRRRLGFLWWVLRTGEPWADCIIMDKDKALEFAEWINKNIKGE
jgi:hypothetical protein